MKHSFCLIACLALIAGCAPLPETAYSTPGQPESLLDKSAERVSFGLAAKSSIADLTAWVDKDQPTKAELSCAQDNAMCTKAAKVLSSFSIPFTYVTPKKNSSDIVLIYERMTVRDCENSFINNSTNFRNLNHPAFGCSISTNILQSVSNRQQIISPDLSELPDAEKAVQTMNAYNGLTPNQ